MNFCVALKMTALQVGFLCLSVDEELSLQASSWSKFPPWERQFRISNDQRKVDGLSFLARFIVMYVTKKVDNSIILQILRVHDVVMLNLNIERIDIDLNKRRTLNLVVFKDWLKVVWPL